MYGDFSEMVNEPTVPDNRPICSLHRNAVRTDAGEDRTVPHTVPVRGGAM
jgi:hypothetical protein